MHRSTTDNNDLYLGVPKPSVKSEPGTLQPIITEVRSMAPRPTTPSLPKPVSEQMTFKTQF